MTVTDRPEWRWSSSLTGSPVTHLGARLPRDFTLDRTGGGQATVSARYEWDGRRDYRLVQITAEPAPGTVEINPEHLGGLDRVLPEVLANAMARYVTGMTNALQDGQTVEGFHKQAHAPHRRRWITDELLAEVADVYRANPDAPTKAVREHFQISPANASRYVKQARERGLLEPRSK